MLRDTAGTRPLVAAAAAAARRAYDEGIRPLRKPGQAHDYCRRR